MVFGILAGIAAIIFASRYRREKRNNRRNCQCGANPNAPYPNNPNGNYARDAPYGHYHDNNSYASRNMGAKGGDDRMPPPPDYEKGQGYGNMNGGYGGDYKVQEGALVNTRSQSRSVPVYGGDEKVGGYAGM